MQLMYRIDLVYCTKKSSAHEYQRNQWENGGHEYHTDEQEKLGKINIKQIVNKIRSEYQTNNIGKKWNMT